MKSFQAWSLGELAVAIDIADSPVGRITLASWNAQNGVTRVGAGGSAVVLPTAPAFVSWPNVAVRVEHRCYAVVPGGAVISGEGGLIIHTPDYVGLPQVGGPLESVGRLKYIDGCSDSLLVSPPLRGEPCLNLLHLPAGIAQTEHTHPSDRIGIIVRGAGVCRTEGREVALAPGMFWYIPTETPHSFHTQAESLDVLAWHPDSDFGPTHDLHPMVNRTIVDGVAANDARHAGIRTQ